MSSTKVFSNFDFNIQNCRSQLFEFRRLLENGPFLSERDHIQPFFEQSPDLSSFIGKYHPDIAKIDRLAFRLNLFGDFCCDIAIGDSTRHTYCFVEFEDANSNSIFSVRGRSTPEWSRRLERGFSQIVDWFCKLDELKNTPDYENLFGSRMIDYIGLLIVGRSMNMEVREQRRLKWRSTNTVVNSKRVICLTFDQLYNDLADRLTYFSGGE
ncbi:Shedu immune nuclease family protein [Gloeobacter violaceus]|uniref:Shedu immune nuclease family protein n=1 Tax=Gloeobacter violaceus TaxID=33072 RepID=UPI0013E89D8C|nr:Shedu immune nuclease family protein [Gloeobacter violaceus]